MIRQTTFIRHKKWVERADEIARENPSLSVKAQAMKITRETGHQYAWRTIYNVLNSFKGKGE